MAENWTKLECEAIVANYMDMLYKELSGEQYSKSEYRRALKNKLNSRSEGSIEYKHQNITAIMLKAGHTYINGYKPAWNYQILLEEVVFDRVMSNCDELVILENILLNTGNKNQPVIDVNAIFVQSPDRLATNKIEEEKLFKPRHADYSARESRNRKLGLRGEEFVLEVEKHRLFSLGREDLAVDVAWTSSVEGDGAGYDIRSFRGTTDEELFIEVKTTNSGKYQPFLITSNEVAFSDKYRDSYSLYRVFDFRGEPNIFILDGLITNHVNIIPQVLRASFN
ncbi:MAG: DUF3883 domain-containing protein [Gammaproteobacteria bacterium]